MKNKIITVAITQRVLASYRKSFFDTFAALSGIKLYIAAGQPMDDEGVKTNNELQNAILSKVKNYYFNKLPLGHIYWQSDIIKWFVKIDPDILIIDGNARNISNWFAIIYMRSKNKPVLGWGLGILPNDNSKSKEWIRRNIIKTYIKSMDGIIAYSTKAANDYMSLGINGKKVFIAKNVVDNYESEKYLAKLKINNDWLVNWKNSLFQNTQLPTIVFVGRLIKEKKVDLLINACIPLFNRCQMLIVGDGPEKKLYETTYNIYKNKIKFVGHQTGESLAKCLISSDIFVLPGSGGLSIFQAMSYGKPVIVSFGDGTEQDLVKEGENGLFFKTNDVNDLRRKIEYLLNNPELIRKMGEASYYIVKNEINLDNMVNSFEIAIKKTLENYK